MRGNLNPPARQRRRVGSLTYINRYGVPILGSLACVALWMLRAGPSPPPPPLLEQAARTTLMAERGGPGFMRMGTHVIVELHGAPFDLLNSSTRVRAALWAAARSGELTVVGEHFHAFPVQGVSGMLLIRRAQSLAVAPKRYSASVTPVVAVNPISPSTPGQSMATLRWISSRVALQRRFLVAS